MPHDATAGQSSRRTEDLGHPDPPSDYSFTRMRARQRGRQDPAGHQSHPSDRTRIGGDDVRLPSSACHQNVSVWTQNSCSATHINAAASVRNPRTDWEPSSYVISTAKARNSV